MRRGTDSGSASEPGQRPGLLTPFRGLSLTEHLAGLTVLVALVLPPIAVRVALDASRGGQGSSEVAARLLGIAGALALTAILVILAPVAGLRRKDLWLLLVPGYDGYYLVVVAWRCGAAIVRIARLREQQRDQSASGEPSSVHTAKHP
jgi:hypothetical protein